MDELLSIAITLVLIFASGAICFVMPIEIYLRWFKPENQKVDNRMLWGGLGFVFWFFGMWLWVTT